MFQSLLRTADQLKIKGLCEPSENEKENFPIEQQHLSPSLLKIRKPLSPKNFKRQCSNKRRNKRLEHTPDENISDKEDHESLGAVSSEEEENDDEAATLNARKRRRAEPEELKPLNMSSHGIMTGQVILNNIFKKLVKELYYNFFYIKLRCFKLFAYYYEQSNFVSIYFKVFY